MEKLPVTLQISLAPSDFQHARELLSHQIRAWQGQVDEVLVTIDFHRSAGRFSAKWEEGKNLIVPLAESIPGVRVVTVRYDAASQARVANEFFGGKKVPVKDFRGGPYYSYFFGLTEAKNDFVFHTDSDMFFGGGSQTWVSEAIVHMQRDPDILFAAPLPGPPTDDGKLLSQVAETEHGRPYFFVFDSMSTRLFLVQKSRFRSRIGFLVSRRPPGLRATIKAIVEKNPPEDLPEHLFTREMRSRDLKRVEFLGDAPGMWSLHPPYRALDFYAKLPVLVSQIENGHVPEAQRGDNDINSSMVDWTEATTALENNRWWKRLIKRARSR